MTDADVLAHRFDAERARLRAIATRLVGPSEADDAVQETWMRLQRSAESQIDNLPAWLTTVISRVSFEMLRAPRRARERSWHVEPWRDEPFAAEAQPDELVAQSDRVSVALQVVLETLSPAERIAFMLHDVFGQPFHEIAQVLNRSPDAARQLASRARRRVRSAPAPTRANRRRERRVVDAWLAAAQNGDFARLLALLDEDAVLHADFGTRTQLIQGSEAIVSQAVLASQLAANSVPVLISGRPGVVAVMHGRIASVMAFEISGDRIVGFDVLADPNRLIDVAVPPAH